MPKPLLSALLRLQGLPAPKAHGLQQALQEKTQGLNWLSHELRTPLQALLALSACIREESVQPEVCAHATDMQQALEGMHGLLNQVLDLAKAQQNALCLQSQPFDLQALLQRVLRLHQPLAQSKGLALLGEGLPSAPLWLQGDEHRLAQMLNNLLANALKFTEHGRVCLQCSTQAAEGTMALVLAVHDTGIGISQSTLRRLFQPFAQADASVYARFGGSGLGLLLVRTLAQAMGGRLEVTSSPGEGSVFSLQLQLPLCQAPLPGQDQPACLSVLLVDDHPINTKVLRHFMQRRGHQVVVAANCQAAMVAYASQPFDCVLLDVQLPDGSGLDLCRDWQQQAQAGHAAAQGLVPPRVVLLSGLPKPDLEQKMHDCGAQGYLQKPIVLAQLNELLAMSQNTVQE